MIGKNRCKSHPKAFRKLKIMVGVQTLKVKINLFLVLEYIRTSVNYKKNVWNVNVLLNVILHKIMSFFCVKTTTLYGYRCRIADNEGENKRNANERLYVCVLPTDYYFRINRPTNSIRFTVSFWPRYIPINTHHTHTSVIIICYYDYTR